MPDSAALSSTAISREAWLAAVSRVLKGAPFDSLRAATDDGLVIEPLYSPAADRPPLPLRPPGRAWTVTQRLDHPDAGEANALALADLEGGATGLVLVPPEAVAARGYGLGREAMARALDGVHPAMIALRLDPAPDNPDNALALIEAARMRGCEPGDLRLHPGLDPLGIAAGGGGEARPDIAAAVAALREAGLSGPLVVADGRVWHEAGAGEALELGAVLAAWAAYWRALVEAGHEPAAARAALSMLLPADQDILLTIARFRAVRLLAARFDAVIGLEPQPLMVEAETSWRMMTRQDPWTNMLRTAIAVFAAGIGGADTITVLPFTLPLGLPDGLARRIARNQQHVILDEAHGAAITDPGAGSGAVEALTDGLATAAWAAFRAIEREGGLEASLRAGLLQARIAGQREARRERLASGAATIIGVNAYAPREETPVTVLDVPRRPRPARASSFGAVPGVTDEALLAGEGTG